jgi:predicted O-methyltransferase YrrM
MSSKLILTDQLYQYLLDNSIRQHPIETALRKQTEKMPTAKMISTPEATQFIAFLVKLMQAKRVIEVGVFTGVTTLAIAMAMPDDGYILACDRNAEWTKIAKKYWNEAKVNAKIDLRIADAEETLQQEIANKQENSFDLAFIDANKKSYPIYYEQCLRLLRPGGLLIFDNALWGGEVANPQNNDPVTNTIRDALTKLHHDNRMDTCLLPIADGMAMGIKK